MAHDIDRLRALWADSDLTQNDIRRAMRVSPRTLVALVREYRLPARRRPRREGQFVEIPEDEIYRRAAAIRAGWPEWRLVESGSAWRPPRV